MSDRYDLVLACMFCGATADLLAVQCEGEDRHVCVTCDSSARVVREPDRRPVASGGRG